jgi:predicted component of viral defense system (DUF524 family)
MLVDISRKGAEVVMERFAATEQRFAINDLVDARTLYQRFAFLRSLVADESLDAAFRNILARPHVTWEPVTEVRRPGQGVRASSSANRAFLAPGPRVPTPSHLLLGAPTLPARIEAVRTESTVDNVPNQFVRFALMRWRDVVVAIHDMLLGASGVIGKRGIAEVTSVLDHLEGVLAEELFREVGQLEAFPAGNQVLQKREGYRDVLRAYIQFELAAKLAWEGGEDVYSAGQRNVAKLYEYWCFLQLAEVVAGLCGASFDLSQLIKIDSQGLGLTLREGSETVVGGTLVHNGRRIALELTFNKTFKPPHGGSWATELRPDCTLEIRSEDERSAWFEPFLLHFDAKYRLESIREIEDQAVPPTSTSRTTVKRDDILKMHAYRDAIKRSSGAYVLFPGEGAQPWKREEYREVLPGVGAFRLRPVPGGTPDGRELLASFLRSVLDHVANQISQHERGRYWTDRVYERLEPSSARAHAVPFLRRPPQDTRVLLGYVRSVEHLRWIREHGLYNLRATGVRGRVGVRSRELSADLVILYGDALSIAEILSVGGVPELHTSAEMRSLGYPRATKRAYFCIPVRPAELGDWNSPLTSSAIQKLKETLAPSAPLGHPVVTTWVKVVEAVDREG